MDWEKQYVEKETPWDKGAAAPPLEEWLEANPDKLSGRIFVPGAGLGHDVRLLEKATNNTEIIGFDVSKTAVSEAEALPKAGGETYVVGDLFNLAEDLVGSFDWIWEHTCFCAIDPGMRDAYVEATWSALKEDGELLGVFYLNPYDSEHEPGGGPPHGTSPEELHQRFEGSGKFEILEEYVPQKAYSGRESLELVLRMRKK